MDTHDTEVNTVMTVEQLKIDVNKMKENPSDKEMSSAKIFSKVKDRDLGSPYSLFFSRCNLTEMRERSKTPQHLL